jgi:endoglucanase
MLFTHRCRILLAAIMASVISGSAFGAPPRYRGANLSGAEYNPFRAPALPNRDYIYPGARELDHLREAGMNIVRLPFRWERLQPVLGGDLDRAELARLDRVIDLAGGRKMSVLLDPHNYARYGRKVIGSPDVPNEYFADFWRRLALRYGGNRAILFGLMNEPNDIPSQQWFAAAQAAIDAIRRAGASNLILVPGNAWTGAHSWFTKRDGRSNAGAFEALTDPADRLVVEVHQYLDQNYSGTGKTCRSTTIGVEKITPVTTWLRQRKYRAFLGEFGVPVDPTCLEALDRTLAYLHGNGDVWLGWTYWAGGPWLAGYPYGIAPKDGQDTPQMQVLRRHLRH